MNARVTLFLLLALISLPVSGQAQQRPCPAGLPEGPALSRHVEQASIVDGSLSLNEILRHGEELFTVLFNACDGRGRPATTGGLANRNPGQDPFHRVSGPDNNSCAGCHVTPRVGGSGEFALNVFVLAELADPVLDTVSPMFSNFRNPPELFGVGPIEMLAREMSFDLLRQRDDALAAARAQGADVTVDLVAKGVAFGSLLARPDGTLDLSALQGVDSDLIIKPFHQSAKSPSIRQFSAFAMNQHFGMQAEERFDLNPDISVPDFDQDNVPRELTVGDITAVTLFQAFLPTPGRVLPPEPELWIEVMRGEAVFEAIGCTGCHIPELELRSRFFSEPGPFNQDGVFSDLAQVVRFDMTSQGPAPRLEPRGEGAVVRAFTDLKRHNLCDPPEQPDAIRHFCNEQQIDARPNQDGRPGNEFFITRRLWAAGSTAPYGHRGDLSTLSEAVLMHGGEARGVRDAFTRLPLPDQRALILFLKSLQILPETELTFNGAVG